MASFCTLLAVLHLMLSALLTTGLADVGAQAADGFGVLAVTGHCRCRQHADLGAIHVQRNATHHHFDVLLLQAGCRTVVARHRAGVARFNTGVVVLMRPFESPGLIYEGKPTMVADTAMAMTGQIHTTHHAKSACKK